jgi:hypothetical protein
MSLNEYRDFLPEFDIGLSLMLSPHPSIVPIEMAAAGMWVITNTFATKTADCLRKISSNMIPDEPTAEAIENALVKAIQNLDDYDSRLKGAQVNWSQNWKKTFDQERIKKIKKFIDDISLREAKRNPLEIVPKDFRPEI